MSQIYKLPLVFEPQPEGGYVVTCPLLPELITEGDTVQEALQNANDALAAIVEALKELKRPLGLDWKAFTDAPCSAVVSRPPPSCSFSAGR
ncbi:MAG: type II toxin-antitoxin system HicB family antitoxin [Anaerolineales bacterium]